MNRRPLSRVAQDVWVFLLGYYTDHEVMPTLREIAEHFKNKDTGRHYSRQWAKLCLEELERQGKIKVVPNKLRGIQLVVK